MPLVRHRLEEAVAKFAPAASWTRTRLVRMSGRFLLEMPALLRWTGSHARECRGRGTPHTFLPWWSSVIGRSGPVKRARRRRVARRLLPLLARPSHRRTRSHCRWATGAIASLVTFGKAVGEASADSVSGGRAWSGRGGRVGPERTRQSGGTGRGAPFGCGRSRRVDQGRASLRGLGVDDPRRRSKRERCRGEATSWPMPTACLRSRAVLERILAEVRPPDGLLLGHRLPSRSRDHEPRPTAWKSLTPSSRGARPDAAVVGLLSSALGEPTSPSGERPCSDLLAREELTRPGRCPKWKNCSAASGGYRPADGRCTGKNLGMVPELGDHRGGSSREEAMERGDSSMGDLGITVWKCGKDRRESGNVEGKGGAERS